MKKLFILLACAATVVACSKDETIASFKGDAIKFGNPFVNKSTRLDTYGDGTTFSTFNVWGRVYGDAGSALIYDETEVTGAVDGDWTADADPQYWVDGASYRFTAISPDYTSVTPGDDMPTAIEYTLSNAKDLLFAATDLFDYLAGQTSTTVEFTFKHLLSKAKFTVTSDVTTGYSHKVHTISVANYERGTYNIGSETWDFNSGDDENIEFDDITVDATDLEVSNGEMLLIPDADGFEVTFTVDFYKGTGTEAALLKSTTVTKAVSTELKAGNAYNFTIDLDAGEEIKFSVDEIKAWTPNPGGDVTLQ